MGNEQEHNLITQCRQEEITEFSNRLRYRADEKVCADGSEASGVVDELVPFAGLVEWYGRGF